MEPLDQGRWKKNIERECPICGVGYLAAAAWLEQGRQTTCSRACSYVLRGRQNQIPVPVKCAVCLKEETRAPSKIKGKHGASFCSPACHYAGRRLGISKRVVTKPYRYSDDGIAKLRKTAAHLYASGRSLAWPETERAVAEHLATIGIPFVHQHVFEVGEHAHVVDFYFPPRALAVELDRVELHDWKLENRRKDAERDERLRAIGVTVRRVRDSGIAEDCVRAVLAALLEGA